MPREFVDSINIKSETQLESCILIANQLGFSYLWISNPSKGMKKRINNHKKNSLLQIHERADIGANNESRDQIISFLRHQRRNVPIIAVKCLIPEITAWAAQDNRVDMLKFPIFQIGKLFTRSIAKLMLKFGKLLEVPLSELYCLPERQQIAALRQIRSALEIAQKKNVPILFNSGSSMVTQMRSPRELVSLGQILLEKLTIPLDSLSKIPQQLLKQNLLKITSNYISPGIYKIDNHSRNTINRQEEE